MSLRLLVSGCTGFIGSNLMPKLTKLGHHVEGISRKPAKSNHKIHIANLRSEHLAKKIKTKSFDAIIHLAADTDEKDLPSMFSDNVVTTLNILEFAREKKINKLIFVSGHNVYSPSKALPIGEDSTIAPFTNYGCTKLLSENLVSYYNHKFDIDVILLRVSVIYGDGQPQRSTISKFIANYKDSKEILLHKYQNGFQKVDLIHVSDVCDAIIRALDSKKKFAIYNIASGKPSTVKDISKILRMHNQSSSRFIVQNISKKVIHFYYDIESAKRELDFEPKVSLEKGITSLL
ncbi:MAG: NAD-dependent epimerase/dehydratase family protein [Nitrososphaerales archaeon]